MELNWGVLPAVSMPLQQSHDNVYNFNLDFVNIYYNRYHYMSMIFFYFIEFDRIHTQNSLSIVSWYRRRKESYFLLSLLPWFWHSFCIPISFPSFSQTMHSFLQNSTQSFSRVCPQCHGYGQIFDPSHPCPRCNVFLHSKVSSCIGKEDY